VTDSIKLFPAFATFPCSSQALFAHHVWNASLLLADRIATSSIPGLEMSTKREETEGGDGAKMSVCELGCGAGIPGLIASRSPRVKTVSKSCSIRVAVADRGFELSRFL